MEAGERTIWWGLLLLAACALFAAPALGADYNGPPHMVSQTVCRPHCSETPPPGEGDDIAFVDRLTVNVDPASAHLKCNPELESRLDPSHVFVDNGNHIAVAWIRSRTISLRCQIVGTVQ